MRFPSEKSPNSSRRWKSAATVACCLVGIIGWLAGAVLITDAALAHLAVIFSAALVVAAIAWHSLGLRRRTAYKNIYFRPRGVPEPLSAGIAHKST